MDNIKTDFYLTNIRNNEWAYLVMNISKDGTNQSTIIANIIVQNKTNKEVERRGFRFRFSDFDNLGFILEEGKFIEIAIQFMYGELINILSKFYDKIPEYIVPKFKKAEHSEFILQIILNHKVMEVVSHCIQEGIKKDELEKYTRCNIKPDKLNEIGP